MAAKTAESKTAPLFKDEPPKTAEQKGAWVLMLRETEVYRGRTTQTDKIGLYGPYASRDEAEKHLDACKKAYSATHAVSETLPIGVARVDYGGEPPEATEITHLAIELNSAFCFPFPLNSWVHQNYERD